MNMENYRDFVGIGETQIPEDYYGTADVTINPYSQVYAATHKGEKYLPFMNRSFISFSFGGKNIEDYNLLATIENNRMNRQGSAEFEDLVDAYNILDGQFYWGTHFKPNKITFRLATDGILQSQLDEFLYWFAGGKIRELILAEHPNRAILARISSPPTLQLLPFEQPTQVMVAGQSYNTSTTLYKGEIILDMTMDEPFWYSKINIFGQIDSKGVYHDTWTDANSETIDVFDTNRNFDVMKVVLEDNIPTSLMIANSMLLGNNVFADMDDVSGGHIAKNSTYVEIYKIDYPAGLDDNDEPYDAYTEYEAHIGYTVCDEPGELNVYILNDQLHQDDIAYNDKIILVEMLTHYGQSVTVTSSVMSYANSVRIVLANENVNELSRVVHDTDPNALIYNASTNIGAHIAGPHMAANTGIETLPANFPTHFYYAGTTYSFPTLEFVLTPTFDVQGYINSPGNQYATTTGKPYNKFVITSLTSQEFRFTTPNIFTSYNEVMVIFHSLKTGESWEEVRSLIRDNIRHYAVRAWATKIIDFYVKKNNSKIIGIQSAITLMRLFLRDDDDIPFDVGFVIDGKSGKAQGTFKCRTMSNTSFNLDDSLSETEMFLGATNSIITLQEDVGDMIKSKYLIIKDRNHPDATGHIVAWEDTNDYTRTYSHKLEHDINNGLKNLYVKYQNMYL